MKALQCTAMRAAVYVALMIAGSLTAAQFAVAQEPTPDQQSAIRHNGASLTTADYGSRLIRLKVELTTRHSRSHREKGLRSSLP